MPRTSHSNRSQIAGNLQGALTTYARVDGKLGVCLISATPPTNPAIGQLRLDTAASGASGMGVVSTLTITSNLTLTSSHTEVGCDATSGPITLTLPVAASSDGRVYFISKIDGTGNAVTIDGNGALIIGSSTMILPSQNNAVVLICNGTSWRIY